MRTLAACATVLALALPAAAQQGPGDLPPPAPPAAGEAAAETPSPLPPPTFEETLEVELVTVPFYAMDAQGDPVYDLRPEEVELWLDGERVAFDYFDRYGADEPVSLEGGRTVGGERLLPPTMPRHVFLLFDLAFTLPRGLPPSREVARKLVEELPETDWLYLLTYHTQSGFQQLLGPVAADAEGKRRVIEAVAGLKPNIERVRRWSDLPNLRAANCNRCMFLDNLGDAYRDTHKMEKSNYAAEARALADSLGYFASFLAQLRGPKMLLYFSQGIDSGLYTEGIRGGYYAGGRANATAGMGARFGPIRQDFEKPLQALGKTGTLVMFVNTAVNFADWEEDTSVALDPDAVLVNDLATGESALAMMSETSGGRVFQHTNLETLKDRIVDFTSAYYEVGFHTAGHRFQASPRATLVVRRPGVEVWAPKWAKTRRRYHELDAKEKRFLIADLILHGPRARAVQEVSPTTFLRLDGSFGGRAATGERALTFAARWPQHLQAKAVELYSVVLLPGENLLDAQIVAYKEGVYSPSAGSSTLDVTVPGDGRFVWGIVAVEASEGRFYLRRMMVEPEAAAETAAAAPGR